MPKNEKNTLIKKLLTEGLSPEERTKLDEDENIDKSLRGQWDTTHPKAKANEEAKKRILNHILHKD
jgi:hypothetical protein